MQNFPHTSSLLLVGGCGYIGSYLYTRLKELGLEPAVCDHLTRQNPAGIPAVARDYSTLTEEELAQFDAVVWFAGHSSVQQALADPQGALANNCLNLFSLAKKLKPTTKLIYASSGSLYSAPVGQSLAPSRETDLAHIPYQNAYDISKFAFDYLAENFLSNFYALRMGTLSGYSQNLRRELLFNAMSLSAATQGKVFVKNRDAYRTVLFLEDLWLLVKTILTTDVTPGVYNVGSTSGMFENGEFDTIYHEHISFFNSRSIGRLAERVGLKLIGTALVKVHGDSPVYFFMHANEASSPSFAAFQTGEFGIAEDLRAYENKVGLFGEAVYERFAQAATEVVDGVKRVVEDHKAKGFNIAFVGAAAKAITVLNAAQLSPDHLLDEAPLKIGLYAPGCNTLVEPLTAAANWKQPTLFILSAWNFRIELTAKLAKIGVPAGSKFYAYFPQPHWLEP